MWDELASGAVGAAVLADTRRLADSFASVDYFERRETPFIVAVNCFDGARPYDPQDVGIALDLDPEVPLVMRDARKRESAKQVLITLVEHSMKTCMLPVSPCSQWAMYRRWLTQHSSRRVPRAFDRVPDDDARRQYEDHAARARGS